MAVEAICAGCGKTWKVPDAARTYKCKQCGGSSNCRSDAGVITCTCSSNPSKSCSSSSAFVFWLRF